MKNKTLMTEGVIWKKIILFALPIFFGNLFQQLYNTADSLIVGNVLGSEALAAVSSSSSLTQLLVGFFNGIFMGAGVLTARNYGANDKEALSRSVHTSIALGLVCSVLLTGIGITFAPLILRLMGTPEHILPTSVSYLRFYFAGSVGLVMYNVFVGILQSVGDSRHPLIYLIVSSFINIVLDLFFVSVLKLGVGSAALATSIAQITSSLLCLRQLLKVQDDYRVEIKKIGFEKETLKKIIRIGIPSGVQNSIVAFANVVVQTNINAFGEMAMAGCGAFSKLEGFAFLPITSFTMALTTFVGQNLGANQKERTLKGIRFGVICSVCLAECIGIAFTIFAPNLIALFNNNPEVIAFGVGRTRVSAPFFFLLAFSHCISAVMRGAGKTTVPMFVMLATWCGIRVIYITVFVALLHRIEVVYWAYPLTWFLSSVIFLWVYQKKNWLNHQNI